ncbi:MAG: hypothetical protein JO041_08610 [Acidobacteria bacterium]|nr:hypothetical protein [Acidobacteriota bacterium]
MLIYLSGAIEYAPDGGAQWRTAITPALEQCGHTVYNPAIEFRKNLTEEESAGFRSWKQTDLLRFQRAIRKIIDHDLNLVESEAGAVLAYWDEYATRGAGSHGELTLAYRRGIPVYLVLGMPLERVSGWILGCATHVFCTFGEAEAFFRAHAPTPDQTENRQLATAS